MKTMLIMEQIIFYGGIKLILIIHRPLKPVFLEGKKVKII